MYQGCSKVLRSQDTGHVFSRDGFRANSDSEHPQRVEHRLLWLEFRGGIPRSVNHLGVEFTTWKHFWVEEVCVCVCVSYTHVCETYTYIHVIYVYMCVSCIYYLPYLYFSLFFIYESRKKQEELIGTLLILQFLNYARIKIHEIITLI